MAQGQENLEMPPGEPTEGEGGGFNEGFIEEAESVYQKFKSYMQKMNDYTSNLLKKLASLDDERQLEEINKSIADESVDSDSSDK